ncbi:MAG: Maf family protein [Chthoniobacterales bacterium]
MRALILASGSIRRADLLAEAGYQFTVVTSAVTELFVDFLTPCELTLFNARRKAFAVAPRHPKAVVLAADTIVALGNKKFGKPKDLPEARSFLEELSGRTHSVFTGAAIVSYAQSRLCYEVAQTEVTFRKLAAPEIEDYLSRIDPLDKAGGYAAQTDPGSIIESISGSFTNVVGLPMEKITASLARFEVVPEEGARS